MELNNETIDILATSFIGGTSFKQTLDVALEDEIREARRRAILGGGDTTRVTVLTRELEAMEENHAAKSIVRIAGWDYNAGGGQNVKNIQPFRRIYKFIRRNFYD